MYFGPSVASRLLPMLILIGSFSLLAVSTSCRRTSITPSLCLLVSMASHSDCAAGDLEGKTSNRSFSHGGGTVIFSKLSDCCCSCCLLRAYRALSINTKGQHGRDRALVSVMESLLVGGVVTPLWDASQENAEISEGNVLNPP